MAHTTDSPKAITDASNEALHGAFEAIDSALWSAVEDPIGGIDRRTESLAGCIECLEAYIAARRKAFDELLHDPRFWCFPVSRRPAEVVADSGEDKPDDQRANHGDKPIVAAFRSNFAPVFFFLGALVGSLAELLFLRLF